MNPIWLQYKDTIEHLLINSRKQHVVTKDNVYQEGNKKNRDLVNEILQTLMLPGSGLKGHDNIVDLYEKAKAGHSCIILMEHYTNFDLPNLHYLLEQSDDPGTEISDAIIPIAGFKLNEEDPVVSAFTEAYTRIVIYPSRTIKSITDETELKKETQRSTQINRAALNKIQEVKKKGKIILVFPAGTRYRPWVPNSKKGVKEIDGYLRLFDYMVFIGMNGNILEPNEGDNMIMDVPDRDVVLLTVSPVQTCKEFREKHRKTAPEGADPKQHVVDQVMKELEDIHNSSEAVHKDLLEKAKDKERC